MIAYTAASSCDCVTAKGPSQKYLEANEVKYVSLWGEGVGDFYGHYFTFSQKNGFMLVFTIIE